MNLKEDVLAKKYATAFLNLHLNSISLNDYTAIKQAADYFKRNNKLFFLLNTPTIPVASKQHVLFTLLEELHLKKNLETLILLVLKHHRVFLIPSIFKQLIRVYERRKKIVPCTFSSSHSLDPHQLEALKLFLEKETKSHIIYTPIHDKKLIAGIRLQSTDFLWEYSVAKQLRALLKHKREY